MLKKARYILKCASKLTSNIPIDLYNNMMAFLNEYPPYDEFYQETFLYYAEKYNLPLIYIGMREKSLYI